VARYWPRLVGVPSLSTSLPPVPFPPPTHWLLSHRCRPAMTSNVKQPYKIEQMPASRLPHPSFTLVLSQSRDFPGLLDYYRNLQSEKYGPHNPKSMSEHEFMVSCPSSRNTPSYNFAKSTIDMRSHGSGELSSTLVGVAEIFVMNTHFQTL
jgi:hypothetical protein